MTGNKKNSLFLTFLLLLLFIGTQVTFAGRQGDRAVKAIQLFNSGQFQDAEKALRVLLDKDPGNPMMNYYYGAARTENGHFGEEELNCLLIAEKNFTPDRLHYYLGIQNHARNNWEQALKYYNQFRLSVPEKEQVQLGLAFKIQQCFDQINPFETESAGLLSDKSHFVKVAEESLTGKLLDGHETDLEFLSEPADSIDFSLAFERELLPDLPGVQPTYSIPVGDLADFRVNHKITYLFTSQFQTDDAKELYLKGAALQKELLSNMNKMEELRKAFRDADQEEKAVIGKKILSLENSVFAMKEEENRFFSEARILENEYWSRADPITLSNFLVKLDKINAVLEEQKEQTVALTHPEDSAAEVPSHIYSELFTGIAEPPGRQSTGNLIYKIQIGAYSKGVPAYRQRLFNKLSMIRKIDTYTDENGVVVYTTGNLTSPEDARKMQAQVRQEGIEDSLIVPFFNGKRITLEQAKKIEAGEYDEKN